MAPGSPPSPPASSPAPPRDLAAPPSTDAVASFGWNHVQQNRGVPCIICLKQGNCISITDNTILTFEEAIDFGFHNRRGALVVEPEHPGGEAVDITLKEFGVRTVAQDYRGGAFTVSGDVVFLANYKDQRLYKQSISFSGKQRRRSLIKLCVNHCGERLSYKDNGWEWNFTWRRPCFDNEIDSAAVFLNEIQDMTFPHHGPDVWEWTANPTSQYTANSAYKVLMEEAAIVTQEDCFAKLWSIKVPSKIAIFVWRLIRDRLPTRHKLQRRQVQVADTSCPFRRVEEENAEHLFFHYKPPMPSMPLTPDYGGPVVSYADGILDVRFISVREEPQVLVGGSDFYAFPCLDPKSERIAWIQWSHPNMPWDKSELWVGYISENGEIYKRVCIAGNDPSRVESPTEPKWSLDGELFFVTDKENGFWNIHKWIEFENKVVSVYSLEAEFTRPLWTYGMNSYEFVESSKQKNLIACSYRQHGKSYLGIIDVQGSKLTVIDFPCTDINNITSGNDCLYVEGASEVLPSSVAKVTFDDDKSKAVDFNIIWSSSPDSLKYSSYISKPEFIEFPTEVPGQNAYAYFYPPSNPDFQASKEEKPPLLLKSHGGPTQETRGILNLSVQYWTSRGWAVVDVNYGGSTGYGRVYRERLLRQWGIVDVNDCCSCATYLVDSGKVDKERLCIMGGSAGGYTTLAVLAFRDTFQAGASLYGIADLNLLRAETHKFESHYVENLVGDDKDMYERSPINHVDNFSCPIIIFQGLEDKVVPPDQARKIYQAVKEKGVPVALVEYEGEQHGFRKAENIKFTLEQEMVFFARLIGHFDVADDITPIKIDNFDD
ncbi:Dipeptidyl aminopeptidase BIII [Glycine max]|nr:Dipeptidyl aminopeptidase BIII [Glycine max]